MSRKTRVGTYSLVALGGLAVAMAPSSRAQTVTVREPLATMAVEGGAVAFRHSTGEATTLKVAGENYRSTRRFAGGEAPTFAPVDREGFSLPDGLYKWTLVVNPRLPAASVEADVKPENGRETHRIAAPDGRRQAGSFTILNGRVVDSNLAEEYSGPAAMPDLTQEPLTQEPPSYDDSDAAAADGN